MSANTYLFELVKSLTPSEKRYFKIHSKRTENGHTKSNYEQLFDALNKYPHKEYDEAVFKKLNKGKKFLKNLPVEKKQLYDLLLKIGKNHTAESNDYLKFYNRVNEILFLLMRGLLQQAEDLTLSYINQYNANDLIKQIVLRNTLKNIYSHRDAEVPLPIQKLTEDDLFHLIRQYELRQHTFQLQRKYVAQHNKGHTKDSLPQMRHLQQEFETLLANPALDTMATVVIVTNLMQIALTINDNASGIRTGKEYLKKLSGKDYQPYFGNKPKAVHLISLIENMLFGNELQEVPIYLKQLETLVSDKEMADPAALIFYTKLLKVWYHKFAGQLPQAFLQIEQAKAEMAIAVPPLTRHLAYMLYYTETELLVLNGNYREALEVSHRMMNEIGRNKAYQNFLYLWRIWEFVAQFALGNYAVLDSLMLGLKRQFKTQEYQSDFYLMVCKVFAILTTEQELYKKKKKELLALINAADTEGNNSKSFQQALLSLF